MTIQINSLVKGRMMNILIIINVIVICIIFLVFYRIFKKKLNELIKWNNKQVRNKKNIFKKISDKIRVTNVNKIDLVYLLFQLILIYLFWLTRYKTINIWIILLFYSLVIGVVL